MSAVSGRIEADECHSEAEVPHLVFVVVEEGQLHVLTGRSRELAAGGRVCGILLLVAAHAHQEEEAGDHHGDGDAGDQDVQDLLLHVLWGLCRRTANKRRLKNILKDTERKQTSMRLITDITAVQYDTTQLHCTCAQARTIRDVSFKINSMFTVWSCFVSQGYR